MIVSIILYAMSAMIGFMFYWFLNWSISEKIYHGPRASDITQCTYIDLVSQKYYQFRIKTFVCPPSINMSSKNNINV